MVLLETKTEVGVRASIINCVSKNQFFSIIAFIAAKINKLLMENHTVPHAVIDHSDIMYQDIVISIFKTAGYISHNIPSNRLAAHAGNGFHSRLRL